MLFVICPCRAYLRQYMLSNILLFNVLCVRILALESSRSLPEGCLPLAAISLQYSHNSIKMAKVIAKADPFAVTVNSHKCLRIGWIRDHVASKYAGNQNMKVKSKNSLPSNSTSSSCSMISLATSTTTA